MTETFRLNGDYSTSPLTGNPSGQPSCEAPISETVQLVRSLSQNISLTVDTPVVVSLGGLTNVNVLQIKTTGGKVSVRLTSADGATQAVPVDTYMSLITQSVPITAIDLTRVAGTSTTVAIFMGERA